MINLSSKVLNWVKLKVRVNKIGQLKNYRVETSLPVRTKGKVPVVWYGKILRGT